MTGYRPAAADPGRGRRGRALGAAVRDGPRPQRRRGAARHARRPAGSSLFAHYDSVQVSYGGNDDGAGVATLLETARALTPGRGRANDIVFLFTDAEEACLCGAEAFVSQDPLAADGGVVLNFESRGSSGPAIMFETSRGNANVVGVYGDAVPVPGRDQLRRRGLPDPAERHRLHAVPRFRLGSPG